MSTYELDDDLVREYCKSAVHGPNNPASWARVRVALEKQLPIPVPTKIGAVVRVSNAVSGHLVFVRTAYDGHTAYPWIALNEPDYAASTVGIGRITEVLSEGVDL